MRERATVRPSLEKPWTKRGGGALTEGGPGEPDADSRASNGICTGCRGTHALPCARCARRCSNATAKDGRHDRRRGDASARRVGWARAGGRTPAPRSESRSSTTAAPPAAGTDAPAGGSPGVRPRARGSCPTILAARWRGAPPARRGGVIRTPHSQHAARTGEVLPIDDGGSDTGTESHRGVRGRSRPPRRQLAIRTPQSGS